MVEKKKKIELKVSTIPLVLSFMQNYSTGQ